MRRLLLTWCLLLAGIGCISQSEAFWQSRDSNYNKKISTGAAPTGTAPTLDGTAFTSSFAGSTTTQTITGYTTSNANDVIVVGIFSNTTSGVAPTVTSVTGAAAFAVTWSNLDNNSNAMTAVASPNGAGTDPSVRVTYYWAHVASAISSNPGMTINLSGTGDNNTFIIQAFTGCGNTSAPWDVNVSLPASGSAAGASVATTSATTTAPGTMILSMSGSAKSTNSNATQTAGAGFNLVGTQNDAGGSDFSWSGMQSKPLTTAQTLSVPFGQSWFNWVAMTHALVGT